MSGFQTWIVDNIVGSIEEVVLHPHTSQDRRRDRALVMISDDITPQQSIRDIYKRFPGVFKRTAVREKLYKRMHLYCTGNYDVLAQEMFEDILRDSAGVIPVISELLCKTSALLFFRNRRLYTIFNDNFESMYLELTNEQKVEFAPRVLRTHGYLLREIPKTMRSKELCDIAVNNSGTVLKHVPTKWKTKKLQKLAVTRSGYALEYVEKKYQLEMTCLAYRKGGREILRQPWFKVLWDKLTPSKKKTCIDKDKRDRRDAEDRWHNEHARI